MKILNTKNKKSLIKILAINLALFMSLINNAFAITASGDADVTIVSPLTISQDQPLNFGIVAPDNEATSTVDQDGVVVGNANYFSGAQKAIFDVTGYNNSAYDITLDTSVTLTGVGDDMSATLSVDGGTSRTLSSGSDSFDVNGTLTIGMAQAAGSYTGTYNVAVNYN